MRDRATFAVRRPPQDPPFSSAELAELRRQLPDPASATSDRAVASLAGTALPVYAGAIEEVPNDAQGLPPPPIEFLARRFEFVRRRDPDGSWYWHCVT